MSPSQSAITQWGWGFYTLWGDIDGGHLRLRPPVFGVVEMWKDFQSGNETLSSPGVAGYQRSPDSQLLPSTGSKNPSQSAISRWGCDFHILRGGIDPGILRFLPRVVGVIEI